MFKINLVIHHNRPSSHFDRTRAVSNKTRILHAQRQSPTQWPNCLQRYVASCPHSFRNARRCLRISLLTSCAESFKKSSLMTGGQRLKAVGELFNCNFQSTDVARTTPLTSKLCTITRLCFGSCSSFQLSSRRSFSKKGIEKYDRRIGVCIKSCGEDAYILKRMQMDCKFFW